MSRPAWLIQYRNAVVTLAAYALAVVVGYVGYRAHVPLAWLLGPMLVSGFLSIAGAGLRSNDHLRRLGQLCIGGAVGLYLTAPVVTQLIGWLPLMVAVALATVLISCFFGVVLSRLSGLDQASAFYASLPGGLAEMANIGIGSGAHPEPIALIQTLRISLVVLLVPPVLLMLGTPDFSPHTEDAISAGAAVLVICGGVAISFVLVFLRLNNPFMIGAILFAGMLASLDILSGRMHPWLFSASQLLIGFSVGCRFRRSMLMAMPRVAVFGSLCIIGVIAATALVAVGVSLASGIGLPDALLATSPGGFSEMAATAQVLHLSVPLVAGYQIVRSIMVNGFASAYYRLAIRSGLLDFFRRLLGVRDQDA